MKQKYKSTSHFLVSLINLKHLIFKIFKENAQFKQLKYLHKIVKTYFVLEDGCPTLLLDIEVSIS